MTITQDVVRDLIPVYLAGEASADTRRLVEDYLTRDAELAREVDRARGGEQPLPPTPSLAPSAEKVALETTRQLIKTRTSTLAVAILFTLMPLSFGFKGGSMTFVVLRDEPIIAIAWWATAAVMWFWHARVRQRLRVSGL